VIGHVSQLPRVSVAPGSLVLGVEAMPDWLVWLGVIPLFAGIGAVFGNLLDVVGISVPYGFGSDWTKLLGAVFGLFGVGVFVGAVT
jgi:hypothetical protein